MDMMVIKDVDIAMAADSVCELVHSSPIQLFDLNREISLHDPVSFEKEVIQGKLYRLRNGDEKVIGISRKAMGTMGLVLEVETDIIECLQESNDHLYKILKAYEADMKSGFWTRLKFAFTGKF